MSEVDSAASVKLDRATPPGVREVPPLAPWLGVGVLVLLTVAAIRVGNGNIALALAPCLVAMLVLALCLLPLRVPMLVLLVLAWAIEAPGDFFASGQVKTPWKQVGELLWGKLNEVINFPPLVFTGFDLVALLLFGVVAYRQLHRSTLDRSVEWVDTPRLLGAFVWLSLVAVAWMGFYGLARGGSLRFVLWQSIRWLYLPIVYSLMRQALRGGIDAKTVGKLVLGVGLFRAGEVILFRWMLPSVEELPYATTHADSVLFATCICILLAMLLEVRGKGPLRLCLLLLPFYVWAMKDNNRRLVWAQVGIAAGMIWFMTPWRPLKLAVARILVAMALPLMIYVPVGWESNAAIFFPVQKVRSMTDSEVNSSTLWRELENYNLVYTYSQHPVLGSGFGHPFEQPIRLPDVTSLYELEPYIPHNSVLGLWAFGGLFGFALLWAMFPVGLFFTARAYRWARTPVERVTALGAASAQVTYLLQGYGDLGFGSWGPLFTVATAYALVGKICIANRAWGAGAIQTTNLRGNPPVAAQPATGHGV
jgi:O-antigen ligase